MRAMILAAGHGTRLHPLTNVLPKPMLPIANRPQVHYQLDLLRDAGVVDVVINLHHLGDVISSALGDGSRFGVRLTYSFEPEILGTGGGIKACAGFLAGGSGPFIVLNGDLLIDVSLKEVLETHRRTGALATMVLREDPRAAFFGAIGADATGRIIDFVGRARAPGTVARQGLFTGIHVMEPDVLRYIPDGPCGINETAYPAMIRNGLPVQSYFQQGYWSDVGTPGRYLDANGAVLNQVLRTRPTLPFEEASWARDASGTTYGNLHAIEMQTGVEVTPPVVVGTGAILERGARIGPSVTIGPGARIGRNTALSRTVVLPGALIEPDQRLEKVIAWSRGGRTEVLHPETPGAPER